MLRYCAYIITGTVVRSIVRTYNTFQIRQKCLVTNTLYSIFGTTTTTTI
jgi:hypothetical protein